MRLAEEVHLFEQLVNKYTADELVGVHSSSCAELEKLGVHKHRDYRRECPCFDFVPFGELVGSSGISVSTYEEYSDTELEYFRTLLRKGTDPSVAAWDRQRARVDHLPFSIAQNILKFNLETIMDSSILRVYVVGCEKEFDSFERIAKKLYALTTTRQDGNCKMEIHFIGPELSKRLDNSCATFHDAKLQCVLHKGLLGTSVKLEETPPDLVYCPNAGVALYTHEWHDAFQWCVSNAKERKSQCLMLFSDYTYEAAWKGHELLLQWIVEHEAKAGLILPVCENRWKHSVLRKHERQTTKQVRDYDNGFIFGFST